MACTNATDCYWCGPSFIIHRTAAVRRLIIFSLWHATLHSPKGGLVHIVYVTVSGRFFARGHAFLFRQRVVSRALGCGERRGERVCTKAQAWPPAGVRRACSGRSKPRGAGPFSRIVLRRPRAKQGDKNPHENNHSRSCHGFCCV